VLKCRLAKMPKTTIDFNFSKILSTWEVCARVITINDVKIYVPMFISEDASPGFNYSLDEHVRSVTARSFTSNNSCQSIINYLQNDNVASPSIVRKFDNNLFADVLEIGHIDWQPLMKILIFELLIIFPRLSIHKKSMSYYKLTCILWIFQN